MCITNYFLSVLPPLALQQSIPPSYVRHSSFYFPAFLNHVKAVTNFSCSSDKCLLNCISLWSVIASEFEGMLLFGVHSLPSYSSADTLCVDLCLIKFCCEILEMGSGSSNSVGSDSN